MGNLHNFSNQPVEIVNSDADYALVNCTIYTNDSVLKDHAVLVTKDKIEMV